RGRSGWMRVARLKLNTPARAFDELICAAFTVDGEPVHPETAERMLGVPARIIGEAPEAAPDANLTAVLEQGQTEIVGRARERLGDVLNEEEERRDSWRDDARVSYDQQIKALTKEANEKKKLARALQSLQE